MESDRHFGYVEGLLYAVAPFSFALMSDLNTFEARQVVEPIIATLNLLRICFLYFSSYSAQHNAFSHPIYYDLHHTCSWHGLNSCISLPVNHHIFSLLWKAMHVPAIPLHKDYETLQLSLLHLHPAFYICVFLIPRPLPPNLSTIACMYSLTHEWSSNL